MIVSHKYKFIFIHITKCAGTSITYALDPLLGDDDLVLGCTPEGERLNQQAQKTGGMHKHSTALQARQVLGEEVWDSYYKFTFVRNPWDMLVSTYHWWLLDTWDDDRQTGKKIQALGDFEDYLLSPYRRRKTCMDFITDQAGEVIVDFVASHENLQADFDQICRDLELPKISLPRRNTTRHKPYHDYYNPLTRELVHQWFQQDVHTFAYSFDNSLENDTSLSTRHSRKPDQLIIHCGYHRVATVWISRVLRKVCEQLGWKFQSCKQSELEADTDLFMQSLSQVDFTPLEPYTCSHIIRDPRDIVTSGYFYHLWCDEKWVKQASTKYNNKSYQDLLNAVSREEGLALEISDCALQFEQMSNWDYSNPNSIEIRFEDIITDPESVFRDVFTHYGMTPEQIEAGLTIVKHLNFEKMAGREKGLEDPNHHFRKGVAGDWRNHFTVEHKEHFKQLYPDILQQLGYEQTDDW